MTTPNESLIDSLKSAGMPENEAKVYLASLELGPSSIWEIAKKSGVKRPTCYVILENLSLKGLASSMNDGRRIQYTVVSPKQLFGYFNRHLETYSSKLSELTSLASKSPIKPKITTFEGMDGIKQTMEMVLEMPRGSEYLVMGANVLGIPGYEDYMRKYFIPTRAKKGISTRAIFSNSEQNRKFSLGIKKFKHEATALPKELFDQ